MKKILKFLQLLTNIENKDVAFSIDTALNRNISLLDIGARDGVGWPWNTAQSDRVDVILVEPDPEEAKKLSDKGRGAVIPYALWSKEDTLSLNINNSPGTSSVFESNMDFLRQFEDAVRFEARQKIDIKTKTVDGLAGKGEIGPVDFVKIDVQGGELDILQGGEIFFKENIVGLEAEVEFSSMYKDQPLFGDVDAFVRDRLGLELWDIRKTYWKYRQSDNYKAPLKGRLVFGDALYLRPVQTLDNWLSTMDTAIASEKVSALITTSIAYGFLDYALTLVNDPVAKKYLSGVDRKLLSKHIDSISQGFYPFRGGNKFLYRILNVLAHSVKPTHRGWANSESHLGSRKKMFFWF